jgi:hypothetical protein
MSSGNKSPFLKTELDKCVLALPTSCRKEDHWIFRMRYLIKSCCVSYSRAGQGRVWTENKPYLLQPLRYISVTRPSFVEIILESTLLHCRSSTDVYGKTWFVVVQVGDLSLPFYKERCTEGVC